MTQATAKKQEKAVDGQVAHNDPSFAIDAPESQSLDQIGNAILGKCGLGPVKWVRGYQWGNRGKDEKWKFETLRKVDGYPDAMFKTVLATNYTGHDGPVSKEDAVYIGDHVYFDFDGEDIGQVIEKVKKFAGKFVGRGANPHMFKWWASGGKGFHCFVPLELFVEGGAKGLKHKDLQCLPLIFREIAEHFFVEGLDTKVYSMSSGRMWRQENIQRSTGKYKVPITFSELENMTPEFYAELVSNPRFIPTPTLTPTPTAPAPGLQEIWNKAKGKALNSYQARALRRAAPAPLDAEHKDRLQSLLAVIDPDGGEYADWFRGVAATHEYYGGSDEGYQVAREWSKQGKKFDEHNFDATWDGLMDGVNSNITIASLIQYVRENEIPWVDPHPELNPTHDITVNEEATLHELTEVCFAKFLIAKHKGRLLYVPDHNVWFYWDGKKWVEEIKSLPKLSELVVREGNELKGKMLANLTAPAQGGGGEGEAKGANLVPVVDEVTQKRVEKQSAQITKFFSTCVGTERGVKSILSCMQRWANNVSAEAFNSHPFLINTQNGIVDLRTKELKQHDPDLMFSKITNVGYQPAQGCDGFLDFLNGINKVGSEWKDYLLAQLGYALTGDISLSRSHWWVGGGANGKSTLTDILLGVMGKGKEGFASTINISTFMRARDGGAGSATPEIDNLRGVRMLFSTEMAKGSQLDEGKFKSLISKDTLPSRRLYSNTVDQIRPVFKWFPFFNDKPTIAGTDNGTWRRIEVMDFKADFLGADADKVVEDLDVKLLAKESEGIFALLVDQCHCLLTSSSSGEGGYSIKLPVPACVRASTLSYRQSLDPVAEFIADHLIKDEDLLPSARGGFIPAAMLNKAYGYYRLVNNKPNLSAPSMKSELEKHLRHVRVSCGNVYKGARLDVKSFPDGFFDDVPGKFKDDPDIFATDEFLKKVGGRISEMPSPKMDDMPE